MKKTFCVMLGLLLAAGGFAQTNTPVPPATPPPLTLPVVTNTPTAAPGANAPAAKKTSRKKTPSKKKAAPKAVEKTAEKPAAKKPSLADEIRSTPLVAGPATVVATNVNVRGRAGLIGEVITKIHQGDAVTVLEEITLKNSKDDEPSAWAKIALPAGAHVWVNALFVDDAAKTVKSRKLNLRGGPGENYSVLGVLEKGTAVKEVQTKAGWLEIEPPAGAYAFVAAQYLKQETAAPVVTPAPVTETVPPPVASTINDPAPIAATETLPKPPVTAPVTTPAPLPVIVPEPTPEPSNEPPPPRIVEHAGVVKGTWSIQAPTKFALVDPLTSRTVNYLYTTSTNLDLRRYKGMHIIVTGEEGLDERWRNTPVLTIQRIQVLE